jgi:trimethylamine---corrinoid protein Co-methyltransferase
MDGFKRGFKPLEILTEDQIEQIHQSTLQVLRKTGVAIHDKKALEMLDEAGCIVDYADKRVRFPREIVEDSLKRSPDSFKIKARDNENNIMLDSRGDTTYFSPSCARNILDLDTLEPREPTRKEFCDFIRITESLPNVHVNVCFPYFGFRKVPQCMSLIESNAAKIRLSTKVQMEGFVHDNYLWNTEMAKVTDQELFCLANPTAPLTLHKDSVTALYHYLESDMPIEFTSGPLAGSSGPVTIAGSLVSNNADAISGIVLAQILKPGARIWTGNMTMVQNMASGAPAFGAIENSLHETIFNQMWRHYGIPCWSSSCAWTSSKDIDYQAGYEMAMAALTCAMSGANVVYFQGGVNSQLTLSPVKAVLDDEVAGMIGRFLRGVTVTDETLAVDVIDQVIPNPGHFLATRHTFDWFRQEQFIPTLTDRSPYERWATSGKKKALDHAREKMDDIIASYKPKPLTDSQEAAVEDILTDARQYYRKKGLISDDEWKIYQEDIHSPNYPYF